MPRGLFLTAVLFSLLLNGGAASAAQTKQIDATAKESRSFLCSEANTPDSAGEHRLIHCAVETYRFAKPPPVWSGSLVVAAYNAERGLHLEEIITLFQTHPVFAKADLLLITELDRYCSRSGNLNTARKLAQSLEMNAAFAVQYVELPRPHKDPDTRIDAVCEHGQAVLSRYPLQDITQLRHLQVTDPYIPPGPGRANKEPRLGGVVALAATVKADPKPLRVLMAHLDVGQGMEEIRRSEAVELLTLMKPWKGPSLMGGDFNTIQYKYQIRSGMISESVVRTLLDGGFSDTHALLPLKDRGTTTRRYLERFIVDQIWSKHLRVHRAGICEPALCDKLSDHLPIWAEISF